MAVKLDEMRLKFDDQIWRTNRCGGFFGLLKFKCAYGGEKFIFAVC
ncbi:hypothetical protein CAMRE0001_0043 [Campylobacter rectus RM3267]|uniref:Uncharacterized protein n=1 Tax=Campylobacter rectus RM3267 TaxID=553218 RepID=B9D3I9_CAMRE|nr:hypothetical protein CAMRE0001_0043 [Campylobacter rectus RM3267]